MGQRVEVQQINKAKEGFKAEDTLATFCYYYPQYKYEEARKLPYKRVKQMLKIALEQKNYDYIIQTQIAVAPHTDKGKLVKELIKQFKEQINES